MGGDEIMKWYSITFPGEFGQDVVETWSEDQIIEAYYSYWTQKMIIANKGHEVTRERCIEDWCTVHWAIEVETPAWKQ